MRTLFLIVVAVALGGAACKKQGPGKAKLPPASGEGAPPMPALPKIETAAPAGEGEARATDSRTTGTLFPRAEAQIAPLVPGTLSQLLVKEGDAVKKGQVLFKQDARDAVLRRDQASAALAAARVQLDATQVEYDRTRRLFDQNAVNQAQMEQMQARLDGARVGVQQAQVMLNMANKAIADATVKSPMDGVVTMKLKSEGEMLTTMPPVPVLILQDQKVLELRFRLPERALADVKPGSEITAAFTAVGQTRKATVVRINPTVDARSRTIELIAEIPNDDGALRPGLLAEIQLGAKP